MMKYAVISFITVLAGALAVLFTRKKKPDYDSAELAKAKGRIGILQKQLERYRETRLIFDRVYALYHSSTGLLKEPIISAMKMYLRDGEQAIISQVIRQKDEYIQTLQTEIVQLKKTISSYKTISMN